jgi:4a-hydroxytetrahydrobiopterin dehydratase
MRLWQKNENGHLVRRFVAKSFAAAMEFMQLVGNVAEELGHHPDMHLTSYRNVEVVQTNPKCKSTNDNIY